MIPGISGGCGCGAGGTAPAPADATTIPISGTFTAVNHGPLIPWWLWVLLIILVVKW